MRQSRERSHTSISFRNAAGAAGISSPKMICLTVHCQRKTAIYLTWCAGEEYLVVAAYYITEANCRRGNSVYYYLNVLQIKTTAAALVGPRPPHLHLFMESC